MTVTLGSGGYRKRSGRFQTWFSGGIMTTYIPRALDVVLVLMAALVYYVCGPH